MFLMRRLHRVSKTSHLWLAITLTYMNGFWYLFGRNVMDKVGNQKTVYYTTSNNLWFCSTERDGKTRKLQKISWFPVSPCSVEALVRWGGKIKYVWIAYFRGNFCAKSYRNRTVYVKIIASQRCMGRFLRHRVLRLRFINERSKILSAVFLRPNSITLFWSQTGPKLVADLQRAGIWPLAR